ncbi:MAG: hypothetical protein MZU95_13575 [Desulfomicrobium escambiense]|nr:hypothetical protein [Desulfomicrobium escambiense]
MVNGAGTGGRARIAGRDVAGKTGTAQVISLQGGRAAAGRDRDGPARPRLVRVLRAARQPGDRRRRLRGARRARVERGGAGRAARRSRRTSPRRPGSGRCPCSRRRRSRRAARPAARRGRNRPMIERARDVRAPPVSRTSTGCCWAPCTCSARSAW